jgi:hypothetical protein
VKPFRASKGYKPDGPSDFPPGIGPEGPSGASQPERGLVSLSPAPAIPVSPERSNDPPADIND